MQVSTIQKRKTETLLKNIKKLDEKYNQLVSKDDGIGFGYGMRAYHRLKTMSFPEDKVRNTFENIIKELIKRNFDINQIHVSYLSRTLNAFKN